VQRSYFVAVIGWALDGITLDVFSVPQCVAVKCGCCIKPPRCITLDCVASVAITDPSLASPFEKFLEEVQEEL
jgi:hypothetical protein